MIKFNCLTYRAVRTCLAAVLWGVLAVSCSDADRDTDIEPTPEFEAVKFQFQIDMQSLVPRGRSDSRAITLPAETQKGTLPENYLDLKNIKFLFFDSEQKFLSEFTPDVKPEGTDYVRYDVTGIVQDEYFTNPQSNTVDFYILVLANYSQYSPQGFSFTKGMTLQQLFNVQQPTFQLPLLASPWWYPHLEDLSADGVYPGEPQYIPMAGLQHFTVPAAEFKSKERIDLPEDINMLRALAKIEVIDRIGTTGTGAATTQLPVGQRSCIEKVELMGFYTRGTILPEFSQWNVGGEAETRYVSAPFVPTHIPYANPYPFNSQDDTARDFRRNFGEDDVATAARADRCQVFSVYIPECKVPAADQQLLSGTYSKGLTKAWAQVTIHNPVDKDGKPYGEVASVLYELKLTGYTNGASDGVDTPLLRNTIYRYEISSVSADIVNVVWTVCPMAPANIDIPGFN